MEKPEEMKERIEHILRAKNMTAAEFAECLGIQASGLSHILSGRNNPSLDFVLKLKNAFPEYNFDWLLLGVGPMTSYEQPFQSVRSVDVQPSLFAEETEADAYNGQSVAQSIPSEPVTEVTQDPMMRSDAVENELEMIIMVYSDGTFERIRPRKN